MPRKQKKYHYIYKTTCIITGKFYIGMHSSDSLDDGYLGSGKILGYSRHKYGDENHTREILELCESREQLRSREKEIVNEEIMKDPFNINLKYGGEGGWDHINNSEKHLEYSARGGKVGGGYKNPEAKKKLKQRASKLLLRLHQEGKVKFDNFRGKKHSEKSKSKMKKSHEGIHCGKLNSQFGTRWSWINKNGLTKKIKLEKLTEYLNNGWKKGIK